MPQEIIYEWPEGEIVAREDAIREERQRKRFERAQKDAILRATTFFVPGREPPADPEDRRVFAVSGEL